MYAHSKRGHVWVLLDPTVTLSPSKSYISLYSIQFAVSAYQPMLYKAPLWKHFHKTLPSLGLSRHTLGPKLFLVPFLSVFFSVFLGAHVLYTIGPGCWMGPSVRPLLIMWPLICLDSVTNTGCKERRARRHPGQSWGKRAQFYCQGSKSNASTNKHQVHVYADQMKTWYIQYM